MNESKNCSIRFSLLFLFFALSTFFQLTDFKIEIAHTEQILDRRQKFPLTLMWVGFLGIRFLR